MMIAQYEKTETLGDRIITAREATGLSTAQTARRLGVKSRTLSRWERNEAEPRANRLVMLAQLLSVAPAWLLEGEKHYAPQASPRGRTELEEKLEHAQRAIEDLSHIVAELRTMIEQQERHRDAA